MHLSRDAARLAVFVVAYVAIAFPRLPGIRLTRPAAALIGAVAMVVIGRLPFQQAMAAIDLDVLTFILGVLLLSAYLEIGGFFEWAAGHIVSRTRSPRGLLAVVILTSGILSAFFMNDTLCLVLTPLIITMLRPLRVRPEPYLLALALAANVGSAMAITGNPQNMLIGIASGIAYGRFLATLAVPSIGGLAIVYAVLRLAFRKQLTEAFPIAPVGAAFPTSSGEIVPFDRRLVTTTLAVFVGMLVAWLARLPLPLVSIAGGALLLILARRDPTAAFARVDWPLLLFFAALFVTVRGIQDVSVVRDLTSLAARQIHGAPGHAGALRDASIVSGATLFLSNMVSNVPAVLLWRPLVPTLPNASFIWLTMAMSSTFAGNFSLLGSMANLIVAERAESQGVRLSFGSYLAVGIPITVLTTVWGVATLVFLAS